MTAEVAAEQAGAGGGYRFLNPQLERAWDAWQAERYQRGEISQRPGYTGNPFRPR